VAGGCLESIAVIGAGVIGGAIVKSLLKKRYEGEVIATRRDVGKLKELEALGAKITTDNKEAASKADIIFLYVKPGDIEKVVKEISSEIKGKLVISTAATIPLKFYKKIAPHAKFVRTMPNIVALVQESFTTYCYDENVTESDKKKVEKLLSLMGVSVEVLRKNIWTPSQP
jgi:pyrroline-5-carboxylate reductase